jgi:hypothetical protein
MQCTDPSNEGPGRPSLRLVGPLGLAAIAPLLTVPWIHHAAPRMGTVASVCAHVTLPGKSIAAIDVAYSPTVASPTAVVTKCHVPWPPALASTAVLSSMQQVRISRIGGLYGP